MRTNSSLVLSDFPTFLDIAWEDGRAFSRGDNVSLPEILNPPESLRGQKNLSLASRPSEIDFVNEGNVAGVRGIVSRKAFLGEIIDYQVKIGPQEVRVQRDAANQALKRVRPVI